jgi:hypothetical protein
MKNFGAAFTDTTFKEIFFKTKVVPDNKYGVFRYFSPNNILLHLKIVK